MSDDRLRPAFKSEDGLPKCIDLLHSCLDDKDWNLACLGKYLQYKRKPFTTKIDSGPFSITIFMGIQSIEN